MSSNMMTAEDIFSRCRNNGTITTNDTTMNDTTDNLNMTCWLNMLLEQDYQDRQYSKTIYLIYSAALVFYMQAGFAMLCAGSVRKKNVQNTMLKNLLDACGAAVAFYCFGYAFAFGDSYGSEIQYYNNHNNNNGETSSQLPPHANGFIGTSNFFLMGVTNYKEYGFWMYQYSYCACSATIVAGTLAERCQMAAYFAYSLLLGGFVYPVIAHSIMSPIGFLNYHNPQPLFGIGVVDFAGGAVVHTTGGVTALFATMVLGPRRGRFHDENGRRLDKPHDFQGHSIALQMLGTIILWFGWYGFNAGSALVTTSLHKDQLAALAAINTTLSGGMAGMVALFVNFWRVERLTGEPILDLKMAMNGSLSGLVAITAGCGVVEPWAALLIGAGAGIFYLIGSHVLVQLRLDDAVDAIPVHMMNGIWGMISVGLFASQRNMQLTFGPTIPVNYYGLFMGGSGRLLAANIVGELFVIGFVLAIMMPFFIWLDWQGWFRSDPLEEIVGLDTSYHGGLALLGQEEAINPEYITQFRKQREDNILRQRRPLQQRQQQQSHSQKSENHYHHHPTYPTSLLSSVPVPLYHDNSINSSSNNVSDDTNNNDDDDDDDDIGLEP